MRNRSMTWNDSGEGAGYGALAPRQLRRPRASPATAPSRLANYGAFAPFRQSGMLGAFASSDRRYVVSWRICSSVSEPP
jgi:hypothetical protein